jgi:hypothetical protein
MSGEANLISEMLHPKAEAAVKGALERFYGSDKLSGIWPGAISTGSPPRLPLEEVEIVVLPLDRIGAPAGASGASVYIAYYSHNNSSPAKLAPSQPLVVKIGPSNKLREEKDGADSWAALTDHEKSKFAFPLHLDLEDDKHAILLAPFQSLAKAAEGGNRNEVEVRDLWHLLDDKRELLAGAKFDWTKVSGLVSQALDALEPAHRGNLAGRVSREVDYATQYEWYLRNTTRGGKGSAKYIPTALFGDDPVTTAFGLNWPNPTAIVRRIIDQRMTFTGYLGAVHGDLHPKNIVLDKFGGVQIIDFGWASVNHHIIRDYVLLDLNLRGTTLPSQVSEQGILQLARFLREADDVSSLPRAVRGRAGIIRNVIWKKARANAIVNDWEREYLIPLFLVGYGLLVHLDSARNQPSLVATVLQLAKELDAIVPQVLAA